MYRIHTLIDQDTGEIVDFRDDLVTKIAEIQRAIEISLVRARAEYEVKIYQQAQQPKLAASGDELVRSLFEQK